VGEDDNPRLDAENMLYDVAEGLLDDAFKSNDARCEGTLYFSMDGGRMIACWGWTETTGTERRETA